MSDSHSFAGAEFLKNDLEVFIDRCKLCDDLFPLFHCVAFSTLIAGLKVGVFIQNSSNKINVRCNCKAVKSSFPKHYGNRPI